MTRNAISNSDIEFIKSHGYRVFMRDAGDTWAIIEKKGKLGYVESGRFGYKFTSVHKPSRDTGTGFGIYEEPQTLNVRALETCVNFVSPPWARRTGVNKFSGIEEYRASSRFNRAYKEV